MSDLVSGLLSSSKVVSSPVVAPEYKNSLESVSVAQDVPSTDVSYPVVAETLGVTAFLQPNAHDVFTPEMLSTYKGYIESISEHIDRELSRGGKKPNSDKVKDYLARIITENQLQNLKKPELLEKVYLHIDLKKRIREINDIKKKLKK